MDKYSYMTALEFYHSNKNLLWQMPALPSNVTTDYEIADWLLNKSNFGWLELDVKFDLTTWQNESKVARFVDHRGSIHPGWNSCCIHGIDVDKTGAWTNYGYSSEDEVPYKWTSISEHTPNIKNFWEAFPYEKYRRIRFMELEPNGFISPHSDAPGKLPGEDNLNMLDFGVPINVAIIHPTECYMTLENYGQIPFSEGKAFIINIRNYHSVINFSDKSRIHLIAHGIPGKEKSKFVELIARSYKKQYERNKI
jgi:hypothetical protein